MKLKKGVKNYLKSIYGINYFIKINLPFTREEIKELNELNELLVYLPANISETELLNKLNLRCNINFNYEKNIKSISRHEEQWFIASANKIPEMLNVNAIRAKNIYDKKCLNGMDFRRYLAFLGSFYFKFGFLPDQGYWTFLLAGNYDRSGLSIIGFDRNGILSHQGWMKNFNSKFAGHRYVILPPRIEINDETVLLKRDYRY